MIAQRNAKKSTLIKANIQPLQEILIQFELKANFSKVINIDICQQQINYQIKYFIFYQYFQELLITLAPKNTPFPDLYSAYQTSLQLIDEQLVNTALRQLEILLLKEFSALIDEFINYSNITKILPESNYYFHSRHGLTEEPLAQSQNFKGLQLQAFKRIYETTTSYLHSLSASQQFLAQPSTISHTQSLETIAIGAKPVSQFLINELLQGKPLKTRALYKKLNST